MLRDIESLQAHKEKLLMLGKLDELEGMLTGRKHNPTVAASGPYGHGVGGLFNNPASGTNIFSAMMYPDAGSLGDIPVMNTAPGQDGNQFGGVEQLTMPILTGVTSGALDDPNNQPTTDCATGPVGGLTKLGNVINTYGRYRASTRPVSITRAGMRSSIIDPIALRLMNPPAMNNRWIPSLPTSANFLINELARRLWELVVSFQRMFARQVWIGNPALNVGERKFIWGLNSQLNTNTHIDYQTMARLTAADPRIYNFNYGLVNGAANIMRPLEEADRTVMYLAGRHRLTPYRYKLRMRPELFAELSAVVPIKQYFEAFEQINNFTNGRVVVNANDALTIRDQLRRTSTLPLNGRFIEVVQDDSMSEQDPTNQAALTIPGTYAADIFATPDVVLGGVPALYWDYFNHNNENSQSIGEIAGAFATFTSDAGLFRWYIAFLNGCLQLTLDMFPRLNLVASQLGYRVTNVAYRPTQHYPTSQPDTAYFVDGGNTEQPTPTQFYTGWSPTTPVSVGTKW